MRIQIASPSSPPRGYLEPIPFHLAQFPTPVHRGGSLPVCRSCFAKRNDSITKVKCSSWCSDNFFDWKEQRSGFQSGGLASELNSSFLFFISVLFLRRKNEKVGQRSPAAHEYIQHYGNRAELKVGE